MEVEVNQLNLLDHTVHQAATFFGDVLPEFDHLPESLPKGGKLGEGSGASHLDVVALGVQRLEAAIDV